MELGRTIRMCRRSAVPYVGAATVWMMHRATDLRRFLSGFGKPDSLTAAVRRPETVCILLLLLFHTALYCLTYSRCDYRVWDESNYFGWGRAIIELKPVLLGDWTPPLSYISAVLYLVVPSSAPVRLFVYGYICKLVFVIGVYGFVRCYTANWRWSFFTTLFVCIFMSYWMHLHAHAFCPGLLLLSIALMDRKGSKDILSLLAFVLLMILVRREYVLLTCGFAAYWLLRDSSWDSWRRILRPTRTSLVLLVLAATLWAPVFALGKVSSGSRLTMAIEQKLASFITLSPDYEHLEIPENASHQLILEIACPPEDRKTHRILNRVIPCYGIISANPAAFGRFLIYNFRYFVNGDYQFTESRPLNGFLNLYTCLGMALFIGRAVIKREKQYFVFTLLSAVFLLSLVPCLVTSHVRQYAVPAIVWFIGVLPYYLFSKESSTVAIAALVVLSTLFQVPHWSEKLSRDEDIINKKRLTFLKNALEENDLTEVSISEPFRFFSYAYCDRVAYSTNYHSIGVGTCGDITDQQDVPVDYIILAEPGDSKSWYWSSQYEIVRGLANDYGTCIADDGGFSLWKFRHVPEQAPLESPGVIVTDSLESRTDLCNQTDLDPTDARELVVRWHKPPPDCTGVEIFLSVDGGKRVIMGRQRIEKTYFLWKPVIRSGAMQAEYRHGPIFGHTYQFWVLIVTGEGADKKLDMIHSAGPVKYLEAA